MKTPLYYLRHLIGALILIGCTGLPAQAQPVCDIAYYTPANGLSQRSVVGIAQDSKGFIWFSTWNGLSRFDGYHFKTYKAHPGDGSRLTSNRIPTIVPTSADDIWCVTHDHQVFLFDSRREQFIDPLYPVEQRSGKSYHVERVIALQGGISWILCSHGAFRVDEQKLKAGNAANGGLTGYSWSEGNLPSDHVIDILRDPQGDEWVLTDRGLRIVGSKSLTDSVGFRQGCLLNDDVYLATAENRLAVYHLKQQQMEYCQVPSPCRRIHSLTAMGSDTLALSTDNGVMLYLPRQRQFRHLDTSMPGQPTDTYALFKDSHEQLWIINRTDGILRYDLRTGEKQHYLTPESEMPQGDLQSRALVMEDAQGTVWAVPRGGSFSYYDPQSKQLRTYQPHPSDPQSKQSLVLRFYCIDRQGNLWFSDKSNLGKISFRRHTVRFLPQTPGYETRAFLTDRQGRLWVATKDGTLRIYTSDHALQGYLAPDGRITSRPTPFGPGIYHLLEDRRGDIYLASRWDGLFRLSPRPGSDDAYRLEHYTHQPDNPYSLSENSLYYLMEDRTGRLWIATHGGGLNLLQQEADGSVSFIHSGNRLSGYPRRGFDRARTIHQAPDGTLLVGTTDGLLTFAPEFERPEDIAFHTYTRIPDDPYSLSCNDVTHIYTDSRQHTYVVTFSGGVNCIPPGADLTAPHIRFSPLPVVGTPPPTDVTLSMTEDANGCLWIVSEALLLHYYPDEHKYECFDQQNLLQHNFYFSEAIPARWNGWLLFGAEDGVIGLDPSAMRPNLYVPPVVFTTLRIQGGKETRPLHDTDEVRLAPDERTVSIDFAALDYTDPSSIRYSYRLDGLEEGWNEWSDTRRASYANLPPGNYRLQVRSTNADGIPNEQVSELRLIVIPTFWETAWGTLAYALLFVLLAATIALIILYIYRLHHRINMEQQLADLKLRFFTDISHELRTPLTLISSPLNEVLEHEELSDRARQHLSLVQRNTRRMLRLVNQILDFRKISNKKMKLLLEHIDVVALTRQVTEPFRQLAAEKQIALDLSATPDKITLWIDRDKVEKMLFNLVGNAFKYTPQGKRISLSLTTEAERLIIRVSDEGIGISPDKIATLFDRFYTVPHAGLLQPSSGIGLSLVHEFVELHLGTISVQSVKGKGSTFLISLPLRAESYQNYPLAEFILAESAPDAPPSPQADAPLSAAPEVAATEASPVKILLVEDNDELRGFLHSILSPTYQLVEATNGREGWEKALQEQPDLVLTDVMMPEMDGLELVKALKERLDTSHIPIIILSAKSSLDDRIGGLEQGIDDYITKPFSSSYLKARIHALLQQRQQLQAWYLQRLTAMAPPSATPTTEQTLPPVGESTTLSALDVEFLQQLNHKLELQIDNADLIVDDLAQSVGMSRTVFYQKVKTTLGVTPIDFIREKRLLYARQLLATGQHNVSTVAYMSGFNDPKYFSKCYKKRFGVTPSQA